MFYLQEINIESIVWHQTAITNVNNNLEFFVVIADALQALQNRHSWIVNPAQVIQNSDYFKDEAPMNMIYTEEVSSAATYWSSIYDQYNSQKYQKKYDLLIVYEKGEYCIFNYNSSWEEQFGSQTKITHINGVQIDEAILSVYDKAYIDYDFQRNKLYVQSIYPRHFGENAVFTIETFIGSISMGIVTEFLIGSIGKWSTIYTMLLVVVVLRFIVGVAFFFVDEPRKPNLVIS